jgi:hypothetical protein
MRKGAPLGSQQSSLARWRWSYARKGSGCYTSQMSFADNALTPVKCATATAWQTSFAVRVEEQRLRVIVVNEFRSRMRRHAVRIEIFRG